MVYFSSMVNFQVVTETLWDEISLNFGLQSQAAV